MKTSRHYSRTQILAGSVIVLLVVNMVWGLISNWGKITLDAHPLPLRKVIAEFERQGHIRLRANFDLDTPVTLHLDKVPVAEALEDLSVVTDSRWRLAYVMGPRRADLLSMLKDWEAGPRPQGWVWINHPVNLEMIAPQIADDPQDPRGERVDFKPAAEPTAPPPPPPAPDASVAATPNPGPNPAPGDNAAPNPAPTPPPNPVPNSNADNPDNPGQPPTELQPLLQQVTVLADAEAVVPSDWNPEVGAISAHTSIGSLIAKLAHAGHGTDYEVFLLSKEERRQRPDQGQAQDAGGPPPEGGGRMNPMRMAAGLQARIDRLPPGQRAAAQASFNDMKAFWLSLKDLSPEDRRAKMAAMRDNPAFQDAMEQRQADRMAKMTPDQRDSRFQSYTSNKASIKGGY